MMTGERDPLAQVSAPQVPPQVPQRRRISNPSVGGLILIAIGVLALIFTVTRSSLTGTLILVGIGVTFIVWGVATRAAGPLIPGGIMTGLGIGTFLSQEVFTNVSPDARGGIVVLGLACGFLVIPLLTYIVERHAPWWPAIPGGILLVVGLALVIGGAATTVFDVLSVIWPVILIIIGVALLLHRALSRPGRAPGEHGLPQ